ncbi:hypothetical protein KR222_007243 [Zaprionus bogoriensis]|nr:hypothetical protein KR222_007243 [Zaprionus bogoriensis]
MDLIKEINEKYQALEAEIDKKLEKVQAEELKLELENERLTEKSAAAQLPKVLSYEEALQRNANTLKSLEIAKARLRSRSTYSPVEKLLQRALANYKKELEMLSRHQTTKDPQDEQDEREEQLLYEQVMQNVLQDGESHRN